MFKKEAGRRIKGVGFLLQTKRDLTLDLIFIIS